MIIKRWMICATRRLSGIDLEFGIPEYTRGKEPEVNDKIQSKLRPNNNEESNIKL